MRGFVFNQELDKPGKVYTMLSSGFELYISSNGISFISQGRIIQKEFDLVVAHNDRHC